MSCHIACPTSETHTFSYTCSHTHWSLKLKFALYIHLTCTPHLSSVDGCLSLGLPEATFTSCLGGMGMVPACGGEKGPLSEESPDVTAEEERDESNTPEHHSEGTTLVTPSRELCTHLVGGGVPTCAISSNCKDNMTLCRDTMLPCLELIPP